MTQPNECMIGTYAGGYPGGMVTLASILEAASIPYGPDIRFKDFSDFKDVEDTSRRGLGYSMATWEWQGLDDIQRYALPLIALPFLLKSISVQQLMKPQAQVFIFGIPILRPCFG